MSWLMVCFFICMLSSSDAKPGNVLYAVNCGGPGHTDINNINYRGDPISTGTPSDYGRGQNIRRVIAADQILYQTERYHTETFGYDIPSPKDGSYVLVLKFSEVWFNGPNQKVFSILLNNEHQIVNDLDIFAKVGRSAAHDEVIPFTVSKGRMKIGGETSKLGNSLRLDLVKGQFDNPKINAFYLMEGTPDDVEPLPALDVEEEKGGDDDEEEEEEVQPTPQAERGSKYKRREEVIEDPYANEDSSSIVTPIIIAVGIAVPSLFFLCRL